MFDLFGRNARRLRRRDRDWHAVEIARASKELRQAREDLRAANRRAADAFAALSDARHVIDQCEADRNALAAERDAERARADRAEGRRLDESWAACKAKADRNVYLCLAESYAADVDGLKAALTEARSRPRG